MGKDILKLTSEVAIEIDSVDASVIDSFILRFPDVAQDIFKELNNESLTMCRSVNMLWCDYLYNQKFWWVRMIQRYRKNMGNAYQQWKKVFKNTPVEFVKEISLTTQQFLGKESRIKFHWSPLHVAAGQGNLGLCKYIFEKTKNVQPRIKWKWTALHVAAKRGHEEICEFVMENLEDKNPSDQTGKTPFHYAAGRGFTNVCRLIIEKIDDKNPAAPNGCTPLHLAANNGHLEIVRLIVETGVQRDGLYNGKTPLDLLSKRNIFFYRLLTKDKFQLCGLIFEDLWFSSSFWLCLCLVMIPLLIWYCALTCEFEWHNRCLEESCTYTVNVCSVHCGKNISNCVPMVILVTLATVFLTIMIRVCLRFSE